MENEHCHHDDSALSFVVPNYKTLTRSEVEYWFVEDPTPKKLDVLHLDDWPTEARMDITEDGNGKSTKRTPQPLDTFFEKQSENNGRLSELGIAPLQREEILCARLCNAAPAPTNHNATLATQ